MWSSENQRLGMKEVSKKAYYLELFGDLINIFSPLVFIALLIYLPIRSYQYGWLNMFYILIPIFMYIFAGLMRGTSETILNNIGYKYDYESDTVWLDEKIIKSRQN